MARKVAVLVGSLRSGSFTKAVAKSVAKLASPQLECKFVEIGDLPLYNPDLDTDNPPAAWTRFRNEISQVSAVLFATPEYNRSIPAALKNALDVGSRPYGKSVWDKKPAAIISVSPGMLGAFGANHHLRQPLVFLNMPVMQQPEAYWSNVSAILSDDGQVLDAESIDRLKNFIDAFTNWIELHLLADSSRT